ncbi:MAG: L-fucokinase [Hespellia sp.]|nr:L-fucokinase [Hespellia sp.]
MQLKYKKMQNLFLRQSYLDSWEDYERSLRKRNFIVWDYVVLTASNEDQAENYRQQIQERKEKHLLPEGTKYVVLSDPDGKRVGSGGATFNVLKYISEQDEEDGVVNHFENKRILVIHSGGDSKRVPQYSACGKLFSPVPRELPNGRPSTLFDEFMVGMSGIPSRIKEGMLILSGDVLLLFNPLQIDFQYHGAAAISIKEPVSTGKNHGVFLNDGKDEVQCFLHKQTEEKLSDMGAVDQHGNVDLDTGAVILDSKLTAALFGLISTDGVADEKKFGEFVNERARISFYGDFLYPLAKEATLEDYYKEAPEGSFCQELKVCRTKIWNQIHEYGMKLLCVSPAEFIHFGTTRELLQLVTKDVEDYEFLNWQSRVLTNAEGELEFATNNALISKDAEIGSGSYIENSYVLGNAKVGKNSIISNIRLMDKVVPDDVVMHGLRLKNDCRVCRIYGVLDNPKGTYEDDAPFLGTTLKQFISDNGLDTADVWKDEEGYLWFANLYPECETMEEAIYFAEVLYRMAKGCADGQEIAKWKQTKRASLYSSFNEAANLNITPWQTLLADEVLVERYISRVKDGVYYKDAIRVFGVAGVTDKQYELLMQRAVEEEFSTEIRIYYNLSRFMKEHNVHYGSVYYEKLESKCFDYIQKVIFENGKQKIKNSGNYHIAKDAVDVKLPVRVNWGGGWTDTPPHCNEKGGVVLNAAIKLKGTLPIQVSVHRLDQLQVEFESEDIGVFTTIHSAAEIQNCHNPYDHYALHKAALIACGIIPVEGDCDLEKILEKLGGGIYLSTKVVGVPKGSGLGTSSILSGACVKAIFEFLGENLSDDALYEIVLCMEQIMSTGGGWQDQVGGITPGIKYITTKPGINQDIKVQNVVLADETMKKLQERFALIYTGQRRLARNLLRDVVGGYISGRKESVEALAKMKRMAALMKFELEEGNVDEFAKLLNEHWELSVQLDGGSTNTCIDQIFVACEDLIDGKFISGAGGGGFLQVIMKKGVTREQLSHRLRGIFGDSGVDVWECELYE